MKLIIAGTRTLPQKVILYIHEWWIDNNKPTITEVVEGGAAGVDYCGYLWAKFNGIPVKEFEAEWKKHGKAAGPIRNRAMAEYADELLLIWDGKSRGSKNMKEEMEKLNKPIHEILIAMEM